LASPQTTKAFLGYARASVAESDARLLRDEDLGEALASGRTVPLIFAIPVGLAGISVGQEVSYHDARSFANKDAVLCGSSISTKAFSGTDAR
jgi:hypothetical protein